MTPQRRKQLAGGSNPKLSLGAAVRVAAHDRAGLERLRRNFARPLDVRFVEHCCRRQAKARCFFMADICLSILSAPTTAIDPQRTSAARTTTAAMHHTADIARGVFLIADVTDRTRSRTARLGGCSAADARLGPPWLAQAPLRVQSAHRLIAAFILRERVQSSPSRACALRPLICSPRWAKRALALTTNTVSRLAGA